MSELKSAFFKNICTKISALLVKKHLGALKNKMNPDAVGGTALLGISKPVIKAHGSSKATAITSAINQAITSVKAETASRLAQNIKITKTPQ
jgi:glycerol-3-phosphate acyltransferase PlsX